MDDTRSDTPMCSTYSVSGTGDIIKKIKSHHFNHRKVVRKLPLLQKVRKELSPSPLYETNRRNSNNVVIGRMLDRIKSNDSKCIKLVVSLFP